MSPAGPAFTGPHARAAGKGRPRRRLFGGAAARYTGAGRMGAQMDGIVPSIVLTLTGAAVLLAGLGALLGRVADEIAALAAIVAGLGLAGLAWLPRPAPVAEAPAVIAAAPLVLSADGLRTELAPAPPPGPPPPLPGREAVSLGIEASEAEPNDTLPSANRATPGTAIDGTLGPGDRDWFAIDVPEMSRGRLVANLVTEEASVLMTLFDEAGQTLGIAQTLDQVRVRTAALERNLDGPRYYVLLTPASEVPARYQLTLAARRW